MNKHLAPLLIVGNENNAQDSKVNASDKQMYTFAKLFTQLTFPPDKDHPFETRNDMYRYLQAHKRACLRPGVLKAFMRCAAQPAAHSKPAQKPLCVRFVTAEVVRVDAGVAG